MSVWDLAEDEATWPEVAMSAVTEPLSRLAPLSRSASSRCAVAAFTSNATARADRTWKEDRDGREEAHGAIFVFEFLDAGQEFDGFVQVCGDDDAMCDSLISTVKNALTEPVLLGARGAPATAATQ